MLQSVGLRRVGQDLVTEQQQPQDENMGQTLDPVLVSPWLWNKGKHLSQTEWLPQGFSEEGAFVSWAFSESRRMGEGALPLKGSG